MNRKIVGICVCMLVFATALPVIGTMNQTLDITVQQLEVNGNEWNLTYDLGGFDECRYVIQTMPDNGYLTCGVTEESDNYYVWIMKLDIDGNEEWHKVNYDLNGTSLTSTQMDVNAMHIIQTSDGGFLITGVSIISGMVQGEIVWVAAGYLWKIYFNGTTEWVQHYYDIDELRLDFTYASIEIQDGYMSTGFSVYYELSGQIIDTDGFLMHTDFDGNLVWIQFYEANGEDCMSSICSTSDAGFLCTGFTDSPEVIQGALWMVKTNETGVKQWEQRFDGPGFEYTYGKGCFETLDGGYIMAGNTNSYGHGLVDAWVIKTDSNGNEVWNQTFGFERQDYTWCMDKTVDNTYAIVVVKNIYYMGGTKDDIYVVEFNESGGIEWTYLKEEPGIQRVTGIYHTSDHGFIVSGRTNEYGISASDGIIYKIGAFPHLDFEIKGGLGLNLKITNSGLGDAVEVPCEINVTGGILGKINIMKNDTIDILAGKTQTVSTGIFFGLGKIDIKIKVSYKEAAATGKILFFWVII